VRSLYCIVTGGEDGKKKLGGECSLLAKRTATGLLWIAVSTLKSVREKRRLARAPPAVSAGL